MYVRGKRLQKGSTHSGSALQQRRTDGRRHTRETTETGACDYTGRSWKGRRNENASLYPNNTRRSAVVVRRHQDHRTRLFTIYKALTRRTIPCVWACVYLGRDSWQTDNRRTWYSLRHRLSQLMRDQRRKAEAYHIVARMADLATDLAWYFHGNMGHVARLIGGK